MSPENWIASSEALPVEGVEVFCFITTMQTRRAYPQIYSCFLRDSQWIPSGFWWSDEQYFPLEAVTHWCSHEKQPTLDDSRWRPASDLPADDFHHDVWVWNSEARRVYQFWCEGSGKTDINNCIYYSACGDPVLHDEFVTKWMPCIQPEDIDQHFADHFPPSTWQSVRRLPNWLQIVSDSNIAQESSGRLRTRARQYRLDFSDVS